jgi:hypothetical protein
MLRVIFYNIKGFIMAEELKVQQLAEQFKQEKDQSKEQKAATPNLNELVAKQDINGIYNVLSTASRSDVYSQYKAMNAEQVTAFKTFVNGEKSKIDQAASTDSTARDKQILFNEALKEAGEPLFMRRTGGGTKLFPETRKKLYTALENNDSEYAGNLASRMTKQSIVYEREKMNPEQISKFEEYKTKKEGVDAISTPRLKKYIENSDSDSIGSVFMAATKQQSVAALEKLSNEQFTKLQTIVGSEVKYWEESKTKSYPIYGGYGGDGSSERRTERGQLFERIQNSIKEVQSSRGNRSSAIEFDSDAEVKVGEVTPSTLPKQEQTSRSIA